MKKTTLFLLFLLLVHFSCTKECLEPMGKIVQQEVPVTEFHSLVIKSGIETLIKEGDTYKLLIETGENRQKNVHYSIHDQVLEIEAEALCVTTANLDPVKVYITSPNLTTIRNSGEYCISSETVLTYPELTLLTEDYNSNYGNIGNFNLKIQNESIHVISNGISNITLEGNTQHLYLGYFSGIGRFEGKSLLAQHVVLNHRGENNLLINPQQSLVGNILSLGDVISYTTPAYVDVEEHYRGRLYFED